MQITIKTKNNYSIFLIDPNLDAHTPIIREFILDLTAERKKLGRNRLWGSVCAAEKSIFIKTTYLSNLASRLRVTLGIRRRSGAFDWPLAELRNSLKVNQLTTFSPRLLGYSRVSGPFWLVKEVILLFEGQRGFLNGIQWSERHPTVLPQLIPRLIDSIFELNRQNIHHLDLWLGNFMLSDSPVPSIKVIDFENCYLHRTNFPAETLGYQLGLLFEFKLHNYIKEADYDRLVDAKLSVSPWLERERFSTFYEYFKRHGAGRKERYLIPKHGQLITGQPTRS